MRGKTRTRMKQTINAEWVYGEYDIPHCSECGYEPKEIAPRCPNCGANMDENEDENKFITEVRKKIAGAMGLPSNLLAEVARAACEAANKLLTVTNRIKEYAAYIIASKPKKTIFDADFGVPINALWEMEQRGIPTEYLRVCLKYKLLEIPPRLMHLATRHKSPRVRKKNQKRIRKLLYGH